MSPSFLKISDALRVKRGYDFELVCNDYLKARYPGLVPWVSTNVESTIPGTPDAFSIDESGALIACQYGSGAKNWRAKLLGHGEEIGDAEKVYNYARNHGLAVSRLVFCTTAEIGPAALHSAQQEVSTRYGFPAEICDLRRLSSDIEQLYPGIAARRLDLPIELQHFMTIAEYIDSGNQRYWPKRSDIEEGRVFTPSEYLKDIETKLTNVRHCLLTGLSGSGKSVLAITYGLWWQGSLQNVNSHPEALVFYLDAASNQSEEAGKSWFQQVIDHDYQSGLFIIDNCHLSPAAITAFCFQLRRKPLKRSAALFISTPKVPESSWEDGVDDYFEHFEENDAVIDVKPENIYKDVIGKYSELYRKTEPDRFVDVNSDLSDETRSQKLENLCSHNLAAARALLEAWGKLGGHLSDINQDEVLNFLAQRHLTLLKAPALGPLCSLASFEIGIHNQFLGHLPANSVNQLRAENLLIHNDPDNYGYSYRIALHPQVASQIFRAYLRQKSGAQYEAHFEEELTAYLKRYLLAGTKNFAEVVKRVYVGGAVNVQHALLDDLELQKFIASEFTAVPLEAVLRYLFILKQRQPALASDFLQEFYDKSGHEAFQARLLAASFNHFLTLRQISQINMDVAKVSLGQLPYGVMAERIQYCRLGDIDDWISSSERSIAARLGYSAQWRKQVAENLDIDLLVERAKTSNAQEFMWFLQTLAKVAPTRSALFLEKLTPELIGEKLKHKSVAVVRGVLVTLRNLFEDPDFLRRVATNLDLEDLGKQLSNKTFSDMYWLTWALSDAVPEISSILEPHLDPQMMINSLLKKGDIKDFDRLWAATSPAFMQRVLSLIDENTIITLFNRSSLARIAAFLEYRIHWVKSYYLSFADKYLRQRLENSDLSDISTFITRLERVPKGGHSLAVDAAEILFEIDLRPHIAQSDLLSLAFLLSALADVDPTYKQKLFDMISAEEIKEAMKHSDIAGIQSIIFSFAEAKSPLLDTVADELRNTDLTPKIAVSEINDLSYLLWNIRSSIGEDLAKQYAEIIDGALLPERFATLEMRDLGRFIWNLVQLSGGADLRILEYEVIHRRVKEELEAEPGSCLSITGVISLVRPDLASTVFLPHIDLNKIGGPLLRWFRESLRERHPQMFSLALQGVWLLDETKATTLLQHVFRKGSSIQDCLALLTEALTRAVTPLSTEILQTTISRIEQMAAEQS